jgi:transcriptional regulator with XRE-family HTH domain
VIDLAENLRDQIRQRGWNQKEAAAEFGVKQSSVSQWLSGTHEPSVEMLLRVCRALKVTPNELLGARSPVFREAAAQYRTDREIARWFRQLRGAWQHHPDERHRIQTAIELAWPNQKEDIFNWLNEKP